MQQVDRSEEGFVRFVVTQALGQMIQNVLDDKGPKEADRMIDFICRQMDSFQKNTRNLTIQDKVRAAYMLCDEGIKFDEGHRDFPISCPTCTGAHCCSIYCATSLGEAKLICEEHKITSVDKMIRLVGEKAWTRALLQHEHMMHKEHGENQGPDDHWGKLSREDRRCIFLGDDKRCKVYKSRPISCRRHFAASPEAECEWDTEKTRKIMIWVSLQAEIICAAYPGVNARHNYVRPLPTAMLDQLGVSNPREEAQRKVFKDGPTQIRTICDRA